MIHGTTITLWAKTYAGVDAFNEPVYTYAAQTVDNVLVGQPTAQERTDELSLSGKMI